MKILNFFKVITVLGIVTLFYSCNKENGEKFPFESVNGWTVTTLATLPGFRNLTSFLSPAFSDTVGPVNDWVTIINLNDSTFLLVNNSVSGNIYTLPNFIDTFQILGGKNIILTADDLRRFYDSNDGHIVIPLDETTIGAVLGTKDSILGVLYLKFPTLVSNYLDSNSFSFIGNFTLNIRLDKIITAGTQASPVFPGVTKSQSLASIFTKVSQANPTWLTTPAASRGSVSAMLIGGGVYNASFRKK